MKQQRPLHSRLTVFRSLGLRVSHGQQQSTGEEDEEALALCQAVMSLSETWALITGKSEGGSIHLNSG
ncbi:hypothetical protein DPEC_G00067590 [Dallia pectoralis]|uniref:Uncharacterized protein n=1 Tax=Dallia pectoralis TaxID=75939 RepID=A0ACC2H9L7_DALPE|nr:hypothetical protein DPEC_G00067590 [Dallia pectoralis]